MEKVKKSIVILFGGILSEDTALSVAATGRVYDLAKIIQISGYKPVIIGFSQDNTFIKDSQDYAIYIIKKKHVRGLKKVANFFAVNKTLKNTLLEIFKRESVSGFFYQSAFARLILPTITIPIKNQIPLGVIANDWYEYSGNNLFYFETELTWQLIYPLFTNFIVTSTFFQKYFSRGNRKNIIYIPAIFDVNNPCFKNFPEHPSKTHTRIAYAGNMKNGKEQIDLVIRAFAELQNTQPENRLELHLYGNEECEIRKYLEEDQCLLDGIANKVFFHGFVDRNLLQNQLRKMDFTILVRPHKRYAEAGFATKFAESFLLGVPVIANLTGDLGDYLKDEINGLVIEENSVSAIKSALIRADGLSFQEKCSMRNAAWQTGHRNFNLFEYVDNMEIFLLNMRK